MAKKLDRLPDRTMEVRLSEPALASGPVATGRPVAVRGLGALANSDLDLDEGVDLLAPIAEQVLVRMGRSKVE